jgi:hypothetical protein
MKLSITYNTATPESAEHGEYADSGFLLEDEAVDPEAIAEHGIAEAVDSLVSSAIGYWGCKGCFENAGSWLTSIEASEDYMTGESTVYDIHLEGFSEEDEEAVFAHFTNRA